MPLYDVVVVDSLHCCLHSDTHSARDFCSDPFGLVHSYRHLLKHASLILVGDAQTTGGECDEDENVGLRD